MISALVLSAMVLVGVYAIIKIYQALAEHVNDIEKKD